MVSAEYPVTWPQGSPLFQMTPGLRIGPASAYNTDIITIDPNTGTQIDVPPHSIPRPQSKLPNAGPLGLAYTDKVPVWQFAGEACVIDVRPLRDAGAKGRSALIGKREIQAWERKHRALRAGDVVLFRSDYTDAYYRPLPEGRRFIADALEGSAPGWPDPDPEAMEYIAAQGVRAAGTDSPSMGPIPDLAEPTHYAGLRHGMVWTEGATRLGSLPPTGALYCMLGPKYEGGNTSEARAFAITGPEAAKLIDSVRKRQVADLSVTLAPERPLWWPGSGVGNHRQPFITINWQYMPTLDFYAQVHMMDAHTGTHLVPPSYALPEPGFDNSRYAPEVRRWLEEYEKRFGRRGVSTVTVEQVDIGQTVGPARVIDVSEPEITAGQVKAFEERKGVLRPGEVVLFRSGYSDRCFEPGAAASRCMADPLNGKAASWPAMTPELVLYLAGKGIRAVGADTPSVGGADARQALMTYWALGSRGMVAVEFLTNLRAVPDNAWFLFAATKIRGAHGGPGRAIAIY
ncbi:MAG: hypothetical protein FJW37_06890 [Acidobacteria bacterium]|nr:hypothetical protein [Acidobacteriota bacterium]